jgi:hypothetical protein
MRSRPIAKGLGVVEFLNNFLQGKLPARHIRVSSVYAAHQSHESCHARRWSCSRSLHLWLNSNSSNAQLEYPCYHKCLYIARCERSGLCRALLNGCICSHCKPISLLLEFWSYVNERYIARFTKKDLENCVGVFYNFVIVWILYAKTWRLGGEIEKFTKNAPPWTEMRILKKQHRSLDMVFTHRVICVSML